MTAQPTRLLTEGETALIEAARIMGDEAWRREAIAAVEQFGLPTRRVEAFHYTDLRALLSGLVSAAERPSDATAKEAGSAFPRLVRDAAVLHFRDGHFFEMGEELPKGVTAHDMLGEVSIQAGGPDNALEWINGALLRSAVRLSVEAGAKIDQTIGLAATPVALEGGAGAHRVSIEVGENADCKLIERSVGPDGAAYLVSSFVDLSIAAGAKVNYIMALEDGDVAKRLGRLSVRLGEGATFNLFVMTSGGALVRQELDFTVEGENAALNIGGINLVGGDTHIDITSRISHLVPDTTAVETFRNVATGRGNGVFQGQIRVAQAAQHTDARMACNTLLLSDHAGFSAKPELEIFADDVQCAHGATVADLEEDYLFYLRARGLSEERARQLLVRAFVAELIEEIEEEELIDTLEDRLDAWMRRHV